jgi:hypothetical protein
MDKGTRKAITDLLQPFGIEAAGALEHWPGRTAAVVINH